MKLIAKATGLGKKLTLITAAFVLAVSSLTAAVPFVLAKNVNAAPGISELAGGFSALSDWQNDRAPVSGVYALNNATMTMGVDGTNEDPRAAGYAFHYTEGKSAQLPANTTSIKASLFVDEDWKTQTGVRAGIWGFAAPASYPILEFSNRNDASHVEAGTPRIQAWASNVGWTTITTDIDYDTTYVFEIVFNAATSSFDYYVNEALVYSAATASTSPFSRVIFNNYNNGVDTTNYTVKWSNFSAGTRSTDTPTNLNFVKTGTTTAVAEGSVLNYTGVTLKWDAIANTERYQIRVTDPQGATQQNRYTGTALFTLNDAVRHGHFGSQQGEWAYEVRSKSDITGLWSNWSAKKALTFDSVKPALNLPSGSIVGNAPYTFAISQIEANPARAYVEIQQLVSGKWKKLSGVEIKNTNNLPYTITPSAIGLQSGVATQIKVNSWDKAGNQIAGTASVIVDLDAPTGAIRYGNTSPINGNVIAYLTTDSPVQDIAGWEKLNTEGTSFKKKYTSNRSEVVSFRDLAGNSGTAEVAITWIDKAAPVATISSPSGAVSGVVTVTGEVSDAHPMNSYFKIDGPNGYTTGDFKSAGVLTHSFDWNTDGLENGTYTISFEARDKAQNKDAGSVATRQVVVDNQKPNFEIVSPESSTEQPAGFSVSGTASDDVSGVSYVEYNIRNLDGGYGSNTFGGAVVPNTLASFDGAAGTWSFGVDGLSSGFYRISVKAVDNAGQHRARSIDVYIDASGPVLSFSVAGRTVTGTTTDPGRNIELTVGSYGPYIITPATTDWEFELPTEVPAGNYDVMLFSSDSFGNTFTLTQPAVAVGAVAVTPTAPPVGGDTDTPDSNSDTDDQNEEGAAANALPLSNFGAATQILGLQAQGNSQDDANADDEAVEGASTEDILAQAVDADNTDGNAMGLAWYWWLLIIAGGATGIWWLIAALRGRSAE